MRPHLSLASYRQTTGECVERVNSRVEILMSMRENKLKRVYMCVDINRCSFAVDLSGRIISLMLDNF